MSGPETPRFASDLDTLIRARYPLVYLVSWEEQRLDAILADVAQHHGKTLLSWSITRGLRRVGGTRATPAVDGSRDPVEAIKAIARLSEPSLVVLKDFHPYLNEAAPVRALRELAQDLKSTYTTVILLSPVLQIPVELEKDISVLDVPLPGFRDLNQLLKEIVAVVRQGNKARVDLSGEQAEALVKAAQGLTLSEAENAFAKAIANDGVLNQDDIQLVLDEKRQVVRKSGLLEVVEADERLASVGGMEGLKDWLAARAGAFSDAARRFGLPPLKGLALVGPRGCGKRLAAKAIAAHWGLPLLRLLPGADVRRALRVAESLGPAMLWTDRPLETRPVFQLVTSEGPVAGDLDETFFLDLPGPEERREIFRIHLARRQRDPARFALDELAAATDGYSGAEIGQAVIAGLYRAFAAGVELAHEHVLHAAQAILPMSATMGDEIARLREWARNRARPASGPRFSVVTSAHDG